MPQPSVIARSVYHQHDCEYVVEVVKSDRGWQVIFAGDPYLTAPSAERLIDACREQITILSTPKRPNPRRSEKLRITDAMVERASQRQLQPLIGALGDVADQLLRWCVQQVQDRLRRKIEQAAKAAKKVTP